MIKAIVKFKIKNGIQLSKKEILESLHKPNMAELVYEKFPQILNKVDIDDFVKVLKQMEEINDSNFDQLVRDNIELIAKKICKNSSDLTSFIHQMNRIPKIFFIGVAENFFKVAEENKFYLDEIFEDHVWMTSKFPDVFIKHSLKKDKLQYYDAFRVMQLLHTMPIEKKELDYCTRRIMQTTNMPLYLLSCFKERYEDLPEIGEILNTRLDGIVEEMVLQHDNESNRELIKLIIKDIMKNENCQLSDIRYIGCGAYSRVFKIGNKILKVGYPPEKYELPKNSNLFLQPLLRYNTEDGFNITVTEEVEDIGKISEDELYQIYKQLRQEKMIWQDCKAENVGKLKRKNGIYFNRIEHVHNANIGFPTENETDNIQALEAGQWVIVDLDFIFQEDDPKAKEYENLEYSRSDYYEKKYQDEIRSEKGTLTNKESERKSKKTDYER